GPDLLPEGGWGAGGGDAAPPQRDRHAAEQGQPGGDQGAAQPPPERAPTTALRPGHKRHGAKVYGRTAVFDVPEPADTVESVDEAVAAQTTSTLDLPPSRWVDVHGPVHFREWNGPPGGPVFVLVHGLGGSLLNWALVAPGLARRGRVLALDLAGFGLTPPAGRTAAVGSNRRVVDGFMKALD